MRRAVKHQKATFERILLRLNKKSKMFLTGQFQWQNKSTVFRESDYRNILRKQRKKYLIDVQELQNFRMKHKHNNKMLILALALFLASVANFYVKSWFRLFACIKSK